ncbi:MAG: aminotransferase class I/II-fold pyridoxal phosphate-dependent enzyme [Candidatus Diapherotrites archaeon]
MQFKPFLNPNLRKILNAPYPFEAVEAKKLEAQKKWGERLIDFGVGDPTDATPKVVREACKNAVDARKSSGYPNSIGEQEFREKAAEWLKKRFRVKVSGSEIVSNFGAKQCIFLMPQHFIEPNKGHIVLIPNPGYPPYTDGTVIAGGKTHYLNILEENDFEPDIESLPKDAVKKAKILYVNSPHNPTGKVYGKEKLKELVDFAIDNGVVLVSDECYCENYYKEPPHSILEVRNAEQCSIAVHSLSKRALMTGYRVGFAAIKNPEIMRAYKLFEQKSHSGVATFIQDAAIAALDADEVVGEMNKVYVQRMDALVPALQGIGMEVKKPEATFYLWAKLPGKRKPEEFCVELLQKKGINATPGNLISETFNGVNPGADRARFALVASLEQTKEAAERLTGK